MPGYKNLERMLMSDLGTPVDPRPPINPVPGMAVTRMLAGELPTEMTICAVTMTEIGAWPVENGNIRPILYRFNRLTGGEVDLELGWDGVTITGSFLVTPDTEEQPHGDETETTNGEQPSDGVDLPRRAEIPGGEAAR